MKSFLKFVVIVYASALSDTGSLFAQITINGSNLALRSSGTVNGSFVTLNQNGYLGTYVTLASPGSVTLTVNALGATTDGTAPNMDISVDDSTASYAVTTGFNDYTTTVNLPAGTHFIRTDFNNEAYNGAVATTNRTLTVQNLRITDNSTAHNNVTVANSDTNSNSLAAADTYIANFRRGNASVAVSGIAAGSQVQVNMTKLGFDFGAAIGQSTSVLNFNTNLQNFLTKNFNMLVPANAGKWSSEEPTQGNVNTAGSDAILNFAANHNMGARQHNLIWSNPPPNQQPTFINNLISSAAGGNASAASTLRTDISNRINYYVQGQKYSQVDVYNESWNNGANSSSPLTYWNIYGAAGIASIYNEMNQKLVAAGQNAKTYVNDYNILQYGNDNYGNFYRQHVEQIENADGDPNNGTVGGIGMQYYPLAGHSAAYMQQVLQNMSVTGLPLSLTEFGVQSSVAPDSTTAQQMLTESMRMMFGNPRATSFLIWGWSADATGSLMSSSTLVDGTYLNLTNCGKDWQDLLGIQDWDGNPNNGWSTHTNATVNPDGTISFNGYYGEYNVSVGSTVYEVVNFVKGATPNVWIKGDVNLDGQLTNADLQGMLNAMKNLAAYQSTNDMAIDELDAICDVDNNGVIDARDISALMNRLTAGAVYSPGLGGVPEPSSVIQVLVGGLALICA